MSSARMHVQSSDRYRFILGRDGQFIHKNTAILHITNSMRKLYTTQLVFSSPWFPTAHRLPMTSDLAPMTDFFLIKFHILMIANLSFECSTPCLKNKPNYFCCNYVKLPPNLTIIGTKMANCLKLYEVHSFSTSPNLCQCTTVLNADVPNWHITV